MAQEPAPSLEAEVMAATGAALGRRSSQMPGILVGIDGSHSGRQALEWALRHAAIERAPLTVLTASSNAKPIAPG